MPLGFEWVNKDFWSKNIVQIKAYSETQSLINCLSCIKHFRKALQDILLQIRLKEEKSSLLSIFIVLRFIWLVPLLWILHLFVYCKTSYSCKSTFTFWIWGGYLTWGKNIFHFQGHHCKSKKLRKEERSKGGMEGGRKKSRIEREGKGKIKKNNFFSL